MKRPLLQRVILLTSVITLLPVACPLEAQESPFVSERVYQTLVNEISGDIAFEHLRFMTQYHRPMGGSPGFVAVAKYIEGKARQFGLEDVSYIPQANIEERTWSASLGELWLIEPKERRLAFTAETAIALADYSRPADIKSAPLIDVGDGVADIDYAAKQVSGAVVLASGPIERVMEEAVVKRGALGLVIFDPTRRPHYPDQYPWMTIPLDRVPGATFAFVMTERSGLRLRREMAQAKETVFRVRAKVVSEFPDPPSQGMVEAFIRGTDIADQDVVLTGHITEGPHSANDDGSGCANMLEIARALKKAIDEGRLPPPRRNIRFWWTNENGSERQYFVDHPEERRHILVDLNEDMVGAKQSLGSRVQFVTRPPFARASFLGDVVGSVVNSLVLGNTAFYAELSVPGHKDPFFGDWVDASPSRPIVSRLGTRDQYDARVIPFHNGSDHAMFNNAIVGIPAITFTNWPDEFIHSTDDDLFEIDPTQLQRNAVAVAATAYYVATLKDSDVPALTTTMYGMALQRIAADQATAMRMIVEAPATSRAAAYARGANLASQAVRREHRALESVRVLVAKNGEGARMLDWAMSQLPTEADSVARVAAFYTSQSGEKPPAAVLSKREQELSRKVPFLTDSLPTYIHGYFNIKRPPGLGSLMAWESLNFVDGKTNYLEIYRAVAAEADSAGEWYYGKVSLEDVATYLDAAEKLGMIKTQTVSSR